MSSQAKPPAGIHGSRNLVRATASNPHMRHSRSASLVAIAFGIASVAGATDIARDTRVLRRGDTQLRVEIVGVEDPRRVAMLQRWVAEAADATRTLSGRYPLANARVHVRETDSRDPSPVPWGQTQRRGQVAVLLYVRRDADAQALRADWTAVHELAHLHHPYLGTRGRWLAEGLASYWQNVLRARAGMLDADEAWRRLDAGFRRGERASAGTRLDALDHGRGGRMRVYWAGAAYWLEADLALRREHRTTLDAVLDRYARCCLEGSAEVAPADFAAALDRVAGVAVFAPLQARYAADTAFPDIAPLLRALGLAREGDALRFSRTGAAANLRAEITARR